MDLHADDDTKLYNYTISASRTKRRIRCCVNGCGYPFVWENEQARLVFIYCKSEGISIFAVALVNCDENNIPDCCNGNSYILSASTGFRFLRSFPPLIPLSFSLSNYLSNYLYLFLSLDLALSGRHSMFVIEPGWARTGSLRLKQSVGRSPLAVNSFCLYSFPGFVFMIYWYMIYWFSRLS